MCLVKRVVDQNDKSCVTAGGKYLEAMLWTLSIPTTTEVDGAQHLSLGKASVWGSLGLRSLNGSSVKDFTLIPPVQMWILTAALSFH